MAKKLEETVTQRDQWIAPTLTKMSAGSAEAGSGSIPDGGSPGTDRS
jgi:hypothetical protein